MENIQIIGNGSYLPTKKINNDEIEEQFKVEDGYIFQRTGIKTRYYIKDENICEMAYKAAKRAIENTIKNSNIDIQNIGLIIVATTSTNTLMPGISNIVQSKLNIENCICLDILAGCAGYVNAFDITRMYISTGKVNYAIVIGVDALSNYTDDKDINTKIILSDGAGATIIGKANKEKKGGEKIELEKIYFSNIKSNGNNGNILTCKIDENIKMDGKAIYKYAVTETVKNIEELLNNFNIELDEVKYIVPHQSNIKIMKSIASKLKVPEEKIYSNIQDVGNTFCASIPIALTQMYEENLLKPKDKIILLGYGGGLNTASILLEI